MCGYFEPLALAGRCFFTIRLSNFSSMLSLTAIFLAAAIERIRSGIFFTFSPVKAETKCMGAQVTKGRWSYTFVRQALMFLSLAASHLLAMMIRLVLFPMISSVSRDSCLVRGSFMSMTRRAVSDLFMMG